jgi:hypothetical protein
MQLAGTISRFCPAAEATARPSALTAEAVGERRYLTVMFCDLVDSTGISAYQFCIPLAYRRALQIRGREMPVSLRTNPSSTRQGASHTS